MAIIIVSAVVVG